jgi:predicted NAD-dependent protein-ADP-ribosyltransferase YbiA (DUF1768 family)
MRVRCKPGLLVVSAESAPDCKDLDRFAAPAEDHVFLLIRSGPDGFVLRDLGPRAAACREPINIASDISDEELRLIGNFAATPFTLDGRSYASVEGFWQSLKFPDPADRERVAALAGAAAKCAGDEAPAPDPFVYKGRPIRVGRPGHWQLMRRACEAKFTQHPAARDALLSTGDRPLTHRLRRDSQTIPGVVMADIWMAIRAKLRRSISV